jgi:hypothetical protein
MSKLIRIAVMLLMTSMIAFAQSPEQSSQASPAPKTTSPQASAPGLRPDPAHQMQMDLDQMESLVNNMAAQVSFIRDTNMSILLNTNVQLWSVLIRDLRLQLEEQQRHAAAPEKTVSPQRH